ncbi:MAG: 3D domain-containing protein [Actinomycetota bacterium]
MTAAGALALGAPAGNAGPGTLKSIESQKRSALLDLYALDSHVTTAQQRLSGLQQQAMSLRAQQQLLQLQLGATRVTLHLSQQRLAENLRDLYKRGDVNTLAVVLGSQSLDDAVTQIDTLNAVAAQDRRMVSATTRAQRRLRALQRTIAAHRARLAAAVDAAQQTVDDLHAARAQRVAFIGRLQAQEQLKRAQIAALQARVAAAQVKSAQLTAAASSSPNIARTTTAPANPAAATPAAANPAASPAPSGGRTITVTSTGYSLPGHTATGLPVGWGVVAVDPNVIPLGTKLTIPGYGEAVAADTGSAVRGNDIDIWFPSLAQARAWGKRTITITLH